MIGPGKIALGTTVLVKIAAVTATGAIGSVIVVLAWSGLNRAAKATLARRQLLTNAKPCCRRCRRRCRAAKAVGSVCAVTPLKPRLRPLPKYRRSPNQLGPNQLLPKTRHRAAAPVPKSRWQKPNRLNEFDLVSVPDVIVVAGAIG